MNKTQNPLVVQAYFKASAKGSIYTLVLQIVQSVNLPKSLF